MEQERKKQIPIWFFIGSVLTLYGLIIFASGIYQWLNPPPPDKMVKLWKYHADVWWSVLMVIVGMVYVVKFWPSKPETLTGEAPPETPNKVER